jgi:Na+/H+ antiporter NhaD/arsenite permease-like protein
MMPATAWISLLVFIACYALFVIFPRRRSWTACGGAIVLILATGLTWREALFHEVNWNVIGLFFGTLVLAEIFLVSRLPAVMAEWMIARASSGRAAMLALCALAGLLSAFIENVAVVLLVAPVAFSLSEKLEANPIPLLIGIAVSSNLQGTATMIGDPPSMILAGYMKMGFLDFFVYQGRPGIFFAVEIGAVASLLVLARAFRGQKARDLSVSVERVRSWVPAVLLVLLVLALSFATFFDPDFKWFAGAAAVALAALGLIWFAFIAKWGKLGGMLKSLDWDTTFFLVGVFVLVGGLSGSGWLDALAAWLSQRIGSHAFAAFAAVVIMSVALSAFIDNVPFLLAMIPVVQKIAEQAQGSSTALLYGLLIGACLGGNVTPIGASANVVTIGMLRKRGHLVGFGKFMALGLPFTAAAVLAASAFVWLVWGRAL